MSILFSFNRSSSESWHFWAATRWQGAVRHALNLLIGLNVAAKLQSCSVVIDWWPNSITMLSQEALSMGEKTSPWQWLNLEFTLCVIPPYHPSMTETLYICSLLDNDLMQGWILKYMQHVHLWHLILSTMHSLARSITRKRHQRLCKADRWWCWALNLIAEHRWQMVELNHQRCGPISRHISKAARNKYLIYIYSHWTYLHIYNIYTKSRPALYLCRP